MRILALTRYGRLAASSRLRILQYLPYLEGQGVKVAVSPLFDDNYVRCLYERGQRPLGSVLSGYGRRLMALLSAGDHDVLWIEKELLPWLPAWVERFVMRLGIPLVVDYDDAVFHAYAAHPGLWVRKMLGQKIEAVMRHATLVIAGNSYLEAHARAAGAQRVEYLPTVVDLARYPPLPMPEASAVFTVGWMGTPVTEKYLAPYLPVITDLCFEQNMRVVLVGAKNIFLPPGVPMDRRSWSEEREVADITGFDVGIMPLSNGPWEQGKCGYKLIQYMACARPVVASAVGANRDIVVHGENGFLAETPEEWLDLLLRLHTDAPLRRRMGEAGRARVEREFSLQVTAPRLLCWLRDIC